MIKISDLVRIWDLERKAWLAMKIEPLDFSEDKLDQTKNPKAK